MRQDRSLSHSRWESKYHVVFIPKYREKAIFDQIRRELGEVLRRLAEHKESRIEEGHLMPDHVHMHDPDPAEVRRGAGNRLRHGKSATHIARAYAERKRNFVGQHFWTRGYFVSTVGRDEEVIRHYIRHQEEVDRKIDQLNLWHRAAPFRGRKGRAAARHAASSGSHSSEAPGFAGGAATCAGHTWWR